MITQIVATTTRIDDATVQSAPTVSLGQTTCPVRTEDRVCPDPIWRSNPAAPLRLRTHAQLRATCGVLWRGWSDGVVPLRVELVALDVEARHLLVANLDPLRIAPRVQHAVTQSTVSPLVVVVAAIRSTTAAWLMSGRPRQVWVMWQNKRCSIVFHFEVPGG